MTTPLGAEIDRLMAELAAERKAREFAEALLRGDKDDRLAIWQQRAAGAEAELEKQHDWACEEMDKCAKAEQRLKQIEAEIQKLIRVPTMPFPDPGAHSWRAFGEAAYMAWWQVHHGLVALADAQKGEK